MFHTKMLSSIWFDIKNSLIGCFVTRVLSEKPTHPSEVRKAHTTTTQRTCKTQVMQSNRTSSYFLSASSARKRASFNWFSRASMRSSSARERFSRTLRALVNFNFFLVDDAGWGREYKEIVRIERNKMIIARFFSASAATVQLPGPPPWKATYDDPNFFLTKSIVLKSISLPLRISCRPPRLST